MGIEIKNLQKSFGEKEVLKGINFTFDPGKINMIIGASGSGKSVMLKCIVGLLSPSGGEVIYDGLDFHSANHKEVRNFRTNMGMLFQYSALFDYMTVEENVAFPLNLFTRWTKKAIKKRVEFCLERVNMSGTNTLFPAELSGGMMKRVGIARAIALNPKYLFVDEPNSGLDPLTAAVIDELIKEITYEFNMCTVVVSHDMNSVVNISDKILFLFNGQKEWEGTKHSILRSGNPNLDKFVFVSDLIRRDIYDEDDEKKEKAPAIISLDKPKESAKESSDSVDASFVIPEIPAVETVAPETPTIEATVPEIPAVETTIPEVPSMGTTVPEIPSSESQTPEIPTVEDQNTSQEPQDQVAPEAKPKTPSTTEESEKPLESKRLKKKKKTSSDGKRRIHPKDAGKIRRKDNPRRPPQK